MPDQSQSAGWLPLAFMAIMSLALLIYVILDGYDLGLGVLLGLVSDEEKNNMVASIGPYWDAYETWVVLGIGVLLTAFPRAHGIIMGALYLPVAAMLLGLILRGVAFDFRVKAQDRHKSWWNRSFCAGSLLASLSQGYMLGLFIVGFERTTTHVLFAAFIALGLTAGYCLLGAGWLLIKTEGELQKRAVRWGWHAYWLTGLGIAEVSIATPLVSREIFAKWFSVPNIYWLAVVPAITVLLFLAAGVSLRRLSRRLEHANERGNWVPFAATVRIFMLAFFGLAYSHFPWVVPQRMDIWQAAAAPESLSFILPGAVIVLPMILGYSAFSYWVFRGKSRDLEYG